MTFIKLTFTNGLKKAGLIEDPDEFHFSTTQYMGEGIHAIMERHARDRWLAHKTKTQKWFTNSLSPLSSGENPTITKCT